MKKIVVLSSSLRRGSKTKVVSKIINEHIGKAFGDKYETEYLDLARRNIPRCDGRPVFQYTGDMADINQTFEEAHGIIICFPVYGQSFPGILKDLLDCTNRLYGKPVFLVEVLATNRSFLALENMANYLIFGHNMLVFPKFLVFKDTEVAGNKIPKKLQLRLERTLGDFFSLLDSLPAKSVLDKSLSIPKWHQ